MRLLEQTLLELKAQGKAILFLNASHGPGGEAMRRDLPDEQRRAVLAGTMREIKSRYERNHVIVEFEGSA